MSEIYSHPEDERNVAHSSSLESPDVNMEGSNTDKYDTSTEVAGVEYARPKLIYRANANSLDIVNDFGHTIKSVGTGETALKYLEEQIQAEETKFKSYIDRLSEIKSRIDQQH
jgi:hypothetical protein